MEKAKWIKTERDLERIKNERCKNGEPHNFIRKTDYTLICLNCKKRIFMDIWRKKENIA